MLEKAGDWTRFWHRRFVRVHRSGVLINLTHEGEATPRGMFKVAHVAASASTTETFEVRTACQRLLHFRCRSQEQRDAWVEAIKQVAITTSRVAMDRRGASPKVPKVARFEKVEQPAAAPEFALSPRSPRSPRSSSACSPRSPRLMLTPRTRARSAPTLCADALEEIHTRFRQEATAAENVEGVADALAQAEHAVLSSMFGAALQRAQHSLKSATCAVVH